MQVVEDGARYLLRLEDGTDLFRALQEFSTSRAVRAAVVVSGIGMLKQGAIGFWNGKEYAPREVMTPHELVGLHGSIAQADGVPSIHLHAALTDEHHQLVGGHLLRATIGVVGEVYVETFPGRTFGRPLNESLGLRTLDLEPGPEP
jgi:predicted DNA-binding protein with PD1-like motif